MIIQTVEFETTLTLDEVESVARERADQFRALPGLRQKYYVQLAEPNRYGGIYVWDSIESLEAYRASDLAATILSAHRVLGQPTIRIMKTLFPLRDAES